MSEPRLQIGEVCTCGPNECAHFMEPPSKCVYRFPGAHLTPCSCTTEATWHDAHGKCLACGKEPDA